VRDAIARTKLRGGATSEIVAWEHEPVAGTVARITVMLIVGVGSTTGA
jgi:hypothetical protein